MKRISPASSLILVLGALLVPSFAINAFGDNCRNVTFRVTNNTGREIDIKKVKYFNAAKAAWKTENVKNGSERCRVGQTCELEREDLAGADGDRITKIKFIYKEVSGNVERESKQFEPTDPVCRREKIYGFGQGWALTISGSTTTSGSNSCRDVQFKYKNNTGHLLQIKAVNYFWGGRWRRELIGGGFWGEDREYCNVGETCLTLDVQSDLDDPEHPGPDGNFDLIGWIALTRVANPTFGSNLGDADGVDITQIKFEYKKRIDYETKEGYQAQRFVDGVSQIFRPTSPRCSDGRVYGEGQGWTIGNQTAGTPTLIPMGNQTVVPGIAKPKAKGKNKNK